MLPPFLRTLCSALLSLALVACGSEPQRKPLQQEPPILDPVVVGVQPPPPNGGQKGTGTTPTVFAIRHFYLGDADPDGKEDLGAWNQLGFNLDTLHSTKLGTNHCKVQPNTPASNRVDGVAGIDNSFGKNIVPLMKTGASYVTGSQNAAVEDGRSTMLVSLDNLDDSRNQLEISGSLYSSASLGAMPVFDGTDVWPIRASSVDSSTGLARATFSHSYVADGLWVGKLRGTLELVVMLNQVRVPIPVSNAIMTMRVSATGSTAIVTDGVLAGSVPAAVLAPILIEAAGRVTEGMYCKGNPNIDGLGTTTWQTTDLAEGGKNGDPAMPCDEISLGIGFDAVGAQLGAVVDVPEPPDPCAK